MPAPILCHPVRPQAKNTAARAPHTCREAGDLSHDKEAVICPIDAVDRAAAAQGGPMVRGRTVGGDNHHVSRLAATEATSLVAALLRGAHLAAGGTCGCVTSTRDARCTHETSRCAPGCWGSHMRVCTCSRLCCGHCKQGGCCGCDAAGINRLQERLRLTKCNHRISLVMQCCFSNLQWQHGCDSQAQQ